MVKLSDRLKDLLLIFHELTLCNLVCENFLNWVKKVKTQILSNLKLFICYIILALYHIHNENDLLLRSI